MVVRPGSRLVCASDGTTSDPPVAVAGRGRPEAKGDPLTPGEETVGRGPSSVPRPSPTAGGAGTPGETPTSPLRQPPASLVGVTSTEVPVVNTLHPPPLRPTPSGGLGRPPPVRRRRWLPPTDSDPEPTSVDPNDGPGRMCRGGHPHCQPMSVRPKDGTACEREGGRTRTAEEGSPSEKTDDFTQTTCN